LECGRLEMSTPKQRERKYQAIRLYNSGRISLADIKANFRIMAVLAHDEYTDADQQREVLGTRDRLDKIAKLARTRDAAKQEMILRFKTQPRLTRTRDEEISKFATRFKGTLPHNFKRYGILKKRTKRVNPPRPGSSRGKISRPRYIGFRRFNRDWDAMERSLANLISDKGANKTINQALQRVAKRTTITVSRKP
jgi:hypothetical protein